MRLHTFLALVLATSLGGCMYKYSPVQNVVDMSETDFSNVSDLKVGESCQNLLFGALPIGGSSSVISAIEKGGLSNVKAVDYRVKSYVVLMQNCITVYGE